MSKENLLSLFRTALTFVGTFMIGHNLFGQAIDSQSWEIIAGVVMSAIGVLWGIFDKTATSDMIESAIRSIIIGGGGLLVTAGILKAETLTAVVGLIAPILAFIQSFMSKAKVVKMSTGQLVSTTNKAGDLTGKLKKAS